ncbi:MAG: D-alanyl-D-alanine carboxypeptidase family protein [Hominilimicola sp.]
MKKIVALAVSITILIMTGVSAFAMADSAACACVINGTTGEVVYSKNINQKHAMASTTKIMTAIIAIEKCNMDDIVTVSANAANQEGSAAYVTENMQLYMRDMLYGLMLNSGNDAAVAIAEHVSGSTEAFAELMNEKALELGLRNTHFVNPSGLDDIEHYTTAADLAKIARYAMANQEFREIVGTQTYQAHPLNSPEILYFSNHNKMLGLYEGATGVKTGFTQSTGRCLVSAAKRDNMEFITVTLDDSNDWNDHMEMLDYAFSEHYPKKVIEEGMRVKVAEIDGKKYNMIAAGDFTMPFKENGRVSVEVISHIANDLYSPINEGEKVGYLEVCCNGVTVGNVDIISESEIRDVSGIRLRNSFYSSFIHIVKILLV